ncbi:MAG: hypothetical protein GF419_11360 [Ignavibacteriales bacterium]|nr:hypothetical protein [Ignavibacteriales bacterium]
MRLVARALSLFGWLALLGWLTLLGWLALLGGAAAQTERPFSRPDQIDAFARSLFHEGDYLRAAIEFDRLDDDSSSYFAALALRRFGALEEARRRFDDLLASDFAPAARRQLDAIDVMERRYDAVIARDSAAADDDPFAADDDPFAASRRALALDARLGADALPSLDEKTLALLPERDRAPFADLWRRRVDPPHRSPALAALLSALLPGAGKFYTGDYADGATAAMLTGLFAALAYANFDADRPTEGWLHAGAAGFFYAGAVFGSAASAARHNALVEFRWRLDFREFLQRRDYRLPDEIERVGR